MHGRTVGDTFTTTGKIVINSVVALQSADRQFTSVAPRQHRYERITDVLLLKDGTARRKFFFMDYRYYEGFDFSTIQPDINRDFETCAQPTG